MKKHIPAVLLLLPLLCGCIDKDLSYNDLELKGPIFQNMEVPIGNFKEISLADLLGADPSSVYPAPDGKYSVSLQTDLEGMDLYFGKNLKLTEAELHMNIINTIPLDMTLELEATYLDGTPVPEIRFEVVSSQTPHIAAGAVDDPTENPIVFKMIRPEGTFNDFIRLNLTGRTGERHQGERLSARQGIRLTDVYLRLPAGFIYEN